MRQWLLRCWHSFSVPRYMGVHAVLGTCNYAIAGYLYYSLGYGHHIATAVGHFLHVSVGFFADRHVSYRSPGTPIALGGMRYAVVEVACYTSIVLTLLILVDWLEFNVAFSRAVVAMLVATAVGYTLNRWWTFRRHCDS